VPACYRGPRLYDTEKTKAKVIEVIRWYKQYRDILNADIIHLRRADGRDWDGIMHVSTTLPQKGLVMLYNPLKEQITRNIKIPLYYTGLKASATISEKGNPPKKYTLDRDYSISFMVTMEPESYTWFTIR